MKHKGTAFFTVLFILSLFFSSALGEGVLKGYEQNHNEYCYVSLGVYPTAKNGDEAPILWRVLEADTQKAYLLSEYVLGNGNVHPDDKQYVAFKGEWKLTRMFDFLNNTFMPKAFTQQEQALLLTSDDLGSIFLPASEDLNNKAYGLGSNKTRQGYGTDYALENGLFKYSKGSSPYWTRTQSTSQISGTRCTKSSGSIGFIRCVVENLGWRPALYLDMSLVSIQSGSGTFDDPYVLNTGVK